MLYYCLLLHVDERVGEWVGGLDMVERVEYPGIMYVRAGENYGILLPGRLKEGRKDTM